MEIAGSRSFAGVSMFTPRELPTRALLLRTQAEAFRYFLHEVNPRNGLVADKTRRDWPASIAAVGMALAAYPVAAERSLLSRGAAVQRTLATLRFFWRSPQGEEPDATGHRGFYYHFLDMQTGRRAWRCELSTIDSTFLFAGALAAAAYFDLDTAEEREARELAEAIFRRADWQWATDGQATVSMGWRPETGFLSCHWRGYNEALLLYALALGSPTNGPGAEAYAGWSGTYSWRRIYGVEVLYAGPLFIHQLSHVWIDFRGLRDEAMRARGIDYFENSRRATLIQQEYGARNPRRFAGYGERAWGLSACEGPGPAAHAVDGVPRRFGGYRARGVPFGLDDGTLAPFAVAASLPFAPEAVIPALAHFRSLGVGTEHPYGLGPAFNPSFPHGRRGPHGWVSPYYFGIDQGPIVLMIENHLTGLVWELMKRCPHLAAGLRRAGFAGGWLDRAERSALTLPGSPSPPRAGRLPEARADRAAGRSSP